jgi:hypothetical protein
LLTLLRRWAVFSANFEATSSESDRQLTAVYCLLLQMEIKLLLTLDLREQAALQAALVTHGAPDALVTLALTGACRISSVEEGRQLRKWLAEARSAGETDFASLHVIERALVDFGV